MDGKNVKLIVFLLFSTLAYFSCTRNAVKTSQTPSPFHIEILAAQKAVKENPRDVNAVSELGALYYKSKQYPKAINVLEKALELNRIHARTLCYLGLSYEKSRQLDLAMAIYLRYLQVATDSPYRKWLEGRHYVVTRKKIKDDIRLLLQQEDQLDSKAVFDNTVIVLPFLYHGKDQKYFVLGKGIAEMIINDLSVVKGVKLIDRLQVEALLEEIASRKTLMENVQNSTSLIGKLFHAKTVVRGGFNTLDEQLVLDVAVWDIAKAEIPGTTTYADSLKNLFSLQKDIVRNLLKSMNIEGHTTMLQHLQQIPTQNISAFIAYSAGIAKEDAGEYSEAIVFFQKALELDPNFRECLAKIEENKVLATALRDPDKAVLESDYARRFVQE